MPRLLAILLALLFAGCQTSGLSGPGRTTTLGYDLGLLSGRKSAPKNTTLPLHIVVAQAGSLQPDPRLLGAFKEQPRLFSRVSTLPAAPELRQFGREVHQRDPGDLVDLAADLGADVLLLVGGQLSSESRRTPLAVLDLTIIGHYLVPSNRLKSSGSVFAALVHVPSGKLAMTLAEDVQTCGLATSASRHEDAEAMKDETLGRMLKALSHQLCQRLADNAGMLLPAGDKHLAPAAPANAASGEPVATVYLVSDGLHLGLILPAGQVGGQDRHLEIGLGERNWVMERGWRWLSGITAFTARQEGVAVIEQLDKTALDSSLSKQKRVWRVELSARQWGEMLASLENDIALQEVLREGRTFKVTKTVSGYSLFHTCQQFALNPLGVADKRLLHSGTMPTPILERRLDHIFGPASIVK